MSPEVEHPDVRHEEHPPAASTPAAPKSVPVRRVRAKLLRILGEIGIVTVGILIAFTLDAWWDGRSLARDEQAHLRALASDFQQNVDSLKKLIELEQQIAASSHQLLLRAQSNAPSPEPLTKPFSGVFNSARYEPVMGAYEALVNSAGLTLIHDDSLRAALAQFAAQVNDQYSERWSNELYFAFARDFGGRIVLGFQRTNQAEREREFQELLQDPRFQGHIAMRHSAERDMGRKYAALLRNAESVLSQVRKQIDD
jgi:hypothetical protein